MNPYRVFQVILLIAALVIGVSTPVFNGLSLLALLMLGSVMLIEVFRPARVAAETDTDTEDAAA